MDSNILWQFRTAQFTVTLTAMPEEVSPHDCFESADDIESIQDGTCEWFCAKVTVQKNGHVIGFDLLGCCAYRTFDEFYTAHRGADPLDRNCTIMRAARGDNVVICHYFPDLVSLAIADARATLKTGAPS